MNAPAETVVNLPIGTDPNSLPRYVVVEGPIGVGKTTLARRLADTLRYPLLLENAHDNPFLSRFYRDPRRYALATQLAFLLDRARQVADLSEGDLIGVNAVADFLIQKDALFAELTLDAQELSVYKQIHDNLEIASPKPELVIYLQAPVDVLYRRIRQRGINAEQKIDRDYLAGVSESYSAFFHSYREAPLLIVNASEIDFAHNDDHYTALLAQVLSGDGNVRYFNPHPTLL